MVRIFLSTVWVFTFWPLQPLRSWAPPRSLVFT
ncbi:hypothetical protein I307_03124 [Cryptococcus deuterogattii 99/473]|uniref:Uncharacterized protein n=1 Tax=Cryptococcus deuterogattii Ram5 TaxID=1296110 RepID=A0A0D0TTQ8_9TREE|nr:hypothetical protein I313_04731 [Cryptococcus deuterogattii Ram5]KIY57629.1 hypothetical protein I307_03124 [Cryptococcus deuterogattii 99/473]